MADEIPAGFGLLQFKMNFTVGSAGPKYVGLGVAVNEAVDLADVSAAFHDLLDGRLFTTYLAGCSLVFTTATVAGEYPYIPETKNGNTEPPQVSLLVRKVTGNRGRRNRGRQYWPMLLGDESTAGTGEILPTARDGFQTGFDAFYSAMVELGLPPVILHNDGSTPTPLTGFLVEAKIATQRRRLR